ncbi:hypothetical protein A3197_18240 [Candidatus Thiodiazotropha endoloripes]|nr:hypothetical protein A3197_18240 [Candidatus Thiodiazotropha endoloripes]
MLYKELPYLDALIAPLLLRMQEEVLFLQGHQLSDALDYELGYEHLVISKLVKCLPYIVFLLLSLFLLDLQVDPLIATYHATDLPCVIIDFLFSCELLQ